MSTLLLKIVEEFEEKLDRKLTPEEFELLKCMVEKHKKGL